MDDIATLRILERILAVSIGGMAIFLGYRLFFHLPFEHDNKGELTLPGIKIVLSRVGPGVFFAAFGTTVLAYSLTQPVTINADGFTGFGPLPENTEDNVSPPQRSSALQAVEMLNCLQRLASQHPDLADPSVPALREAKRALLLSVWDGDNWGGPQQLSPTGPTDSANSKLRNFYHNTYKSCPQ